MANMSLKSFESAVMLMLLFSFLICCYFFGFLTSNPTTGFIQNICMYAFCFCCKCRWRFTYVSLLLSSHFYIFLFAFISVHLFLSFVLFMCLMSYQMFSTQIWIFPHFLCCRMCGELHYMQCNFMWTQ